jgi:hypothetical protein
MAFFFLLLFWISVYEFLLHGLENPIIEGALLFCMSMSLLLTWGAYLKSGNNLQRMGLWLKSDSHSRRAFRIIMVVLNLAVVGRIIVDVYQLTFGLK